MPRDRHANHPPCPPNSAEAALLTVIARLNADPAIDGILVQLPLPAHISTSAAIEAVDPDKDVDGFHPLNAGRCLGSARVGSCTPLGVMKLLAETGVPLAGARALVLGRSSIVGRPLVAPLAANATVTVAHSRTQEAVECRRGRGAGGGDWQTGVGTRRVGSLPGAAVIDVGINRQPDGRLVGDVAFAEARAIAAAITPAPGGVGPMTIACLLENTVTAALRRRDDAPRI